MEIRPARKEDYPQLAEMKWLHCEEDDADYGENNLCGIDRNAFIADFISFLNEHGEYRIFIADDNGTVACAMFVYMIPKTPKPNGKSKYIAYLTNVFTRAEYRNNGLGSKLLSFIKNYLTDEKCELMFVWPSEKSVNWYSRNGFCNENEIFECVLTEE